MDYEVLYVKDAIEEGALYLTGDAELDEYVKYMTKDGRIILVKSQEHLMEIVCRLTEELNKFINEKGDK